MLITISDHLDQLLSVVNVRMPRLITKFAILGAFFLISGYIIRTGFFSGVVLLRNGACSGFS